MSTNESPTSLSAERSFLLTVAYDGTNYGGWQRQINSITIQQRMEEAVAAASGHRAHVVGSGRTDSGVHAIGQVASMALPSWSASAESLVPALNRWLPEDIVVRSCCEARHRFHAIRESIAKRYRYMIHVSSIPDPIQRKYRWWVRRPVNVDKMRQAAQHLIGTIDFASFQALGSTRISTVRTVTDLDVWVAPANDGYDVVVEIQADGFLYNMVRRIVAMLVRVGLGRLSIDGFDAILAARNTRTISATAPAQGLYLLRVDYPPECFVTPSTTPRRSTSASPTQPDFH